MEPRFTMLETVRELALGALDAAGERAGTEQARANGLADWAAALHQRFQPCLPIDRCGIDHEQRDRLEWQQFRRHPGVLRMHWPACRRRPASDMRHNRHRGSRRLHDAGLVAKGFMGARRRNRG